MGHRRVLFASVDLTAVPRRWVVLSARRDRLGTLAVAGESSRQGLTHQLQPFGGFCSETSGVDAVRAKAAGIRSPDAPHTVRSRVGSSRISAVRWGVAGRIVWSWCSVSMSALIAALTICS